MPDLAHDTRSRPAPKSLETTLLLVRTTVAGDSIVTPRV